jgi:hypothetical protein
MLNNNIYKLVVYCMFQKFRDSIKWIFHEI